MTCLLEYNSGRWQAMMYLQRFAHAKKSSVTENISIYDIDS
jgi:hypothetical protein